MTWSCLLCRFMRGPPRRRSCAARPRRPPRPAARGRAAPPRASRSSIRSLSSSSTLASAVASTPAGAAPEARSASIIVGDHGDERLPVAVPQLAHGRAGRAGVEGGSEQVLVLVPGGEEGAHHRLDVLGRSPAAAELVGGRGRLVVHLLHECRDGARLVLEVEVERRAGDAGAARDVGDVDRVEAALRIWRRWWSSDSSRAVRRRSPRAGWSLMLRPAGLPRGPGRPGSPWRGGRARR